MDTHELLRKITSLPIIADGLAEDLLGGNFRSVFKGQGIEFDEARHYQWGDDVRSIDWNLSARFGFPFVKMYREEREITVMILLDISASMRSGPWPDQAGTNPTRFEQGLLAAALIAFSAERTGQRVGGLFFDREIERVFPPYKGRRHAMALVSGALRYHESAAGPENRRARRSGAGGNAASGAGSNLGAALAGAGRLLKRRSLVLVISDFLSVNWSGELGDLARKHDVIALRLSDPLDDDIPDMGLIPVEDPETGLRIHAPTGSVSFREAWKEWHDERAKVWLSLCRQAGAASLELSTAADASAALFRFFGVERRYGASRRGRRRTGGRR
ncbi:MAG: DUF58 domain-containing protein [Treponema sp.]|jgi:uncharacterized protein (DUF58 family)|nr:DUF58 domain-containing protein [Treponema sp.]